jgi:oligopeptide transport system permease protein
MSPSRHPVARSIISRLLQGLVVLFVLMTVTFFLIRALPGGPFTQEKAIPAHILEKIREHYGLNEKLHVQYLRNLKNLLQGDLAYSLRMEGRPVAEVIRQVFPVSLTLGLAAMGFAMTVGIPIGVIAAARRNTWLDHGSMALAMVGICLPTLVVGPLLAWFFGVYLHILPATGWPPVSPTGWILPAATLGLGYAAYLSRLTRAGMIEVLNQDFIRTARAKGLKEKAVLVRHGLRGGLIPVVAYLGPAFAGIVSGSIIIESIFMVPGMGLQLVKAIESRDAPMLQGLVLLYGTLTVVANLAADLLQIWLNPRLRSST